LEVSLSIVFFLLSKGAQVQAQLQNAACLVWRRTWLYDRQTISGRLAHFASLR